MDSENNPDRPVENARDASPADNTADKTQGAASAPAEGGETADERRARMMAEIKAKAAARMAAKGGATTTSDAPPATSDLPATTPQSAPSPSATPTPANVEATAADAPIDETPEQKRARIMAETKAKAAARMAAKGVAPSASDATPATSIAAQSAPTQEVPAGTTPAARVAPGAAKAATTPTASVAAGIPQAVAARQHPTVVDTIPDPPINKMRRRIIWASIVGFMGTSLLMFFRFFLPRTIFEPSSVFRVGFPGDYGIGVDTKYQQLYRVWVVKTSERLFVINAVCTHLGCTPDWKASENKFKCPCHGSGYDSEGINFEGPAPRPMDRAHIELDAEGQIVVNKGILYDWPKGGENKFEKENAYIPL
ncbi:MAG TPA: Rieske 2Fe-2S domain-containing protein [Pyrinomonadaceae bacterium]|nr:Rieske 2Fe-2S domain-containing protein [Pyrinomonadaceae bacterium]